MRGWFALIITHKRAGVRKNSHFLYRGFVENDGTGGGGGGKGYKIYENAFFHANYS